MWDILGWIFSVILVLVGGFLFWFFETDQHLSRRVTEMMKKDGRLEGEPEYMKDFRVAESEWDEDFSRRNKRRAGIILAAGLILLALMVSKTFLW